MSPPRISRSFIISIALATICVAGALLVSRAVEPDDDHAGEPPARFSPSAVDAITPALGGICERDICSRFGDPYSQASCALGIASCFETPTAQPGADSTP